MHVSLRCHSLSISAPPTRGRVQRFALRKKPPANRVLRSKPDFLNEQRTVAAGRRHELISGAHFPGPDYFRVRQKHRPVRSFCEGYLLALKQLFELSLCTMTRGLI